MIKKFLTIVTVLVSITIFNSTSYSIEPDVFVQSTVNRAKHSRRNLNKEQRVEG